ncbi:HAD family hydrolase [Alicyclobacillus herbarius]|uniref:HAD family hydrolase n=1 Tax=Alicyclobacillus herbarius TaxID=122960 RepID=UPI00041015BE|nr:HAD family hydrolase [Alicyclobacillus herbarius]
MYNWVLFDIDGVMLSEERYFDASSLAVYELLTSPQYLNLRIANLPGFSVRLDDASVRQIRRQVFANDEFLSFIKNRGINANWDMVYLQFVAALAAITERIVPEPQPERETAASDDSDWQNQRRRLIERLRHRVSQGSTVSSEVFHAYARLFADCQGKDEMFAVCRRVLSPFVGDAEQDIWDLGKDVFQEWYLGEAYGGPGWHGQATGKTGYLEQERPVVDPDAFRQLLDEIVSMGIQTGIATGRPRLETEVPLRSYDWLSRFDANRITTASEVLEAQTVRPEAGPLSKPNPFSYLRSYLGTADFSAVLDTALPLPPEEGRRILVVGDSVADALAANAMGCDFAAVLTGLEGPAARSSFATLSCTYILNDVLELRQVLAKTATEPEGVQR